MKLLSIKGKETLLSSSRLFHIEMYVNGVVFEALFFERFPLAELRALFNSDVFATNQKLEDRNIINNSAREMSTHNISIYILRKSLNSQISFRLLLNFTEIG